MYSLNGFTKSTSPDSYNVLFTTANENIKLAVLWGSWLFKAIQLIHSWTAPEWKWKTLKRLKNVYLQTKARIRPWLSYMCHIRSTAICTPQPDAPLYFPPHQHYQGAASPQSGFKSLFSDPSFEVAMLGIQWCSVHVKTKEQKIRLNSIDKPIRPNIFDHIRPIKTSTEEIQMCFCAPRLCLLFSIFIIYIHTYIHIHVYFCSLWYIYIHKYVCILIYIYIYIHTYI